MSEKDKKGSEKETTPAKTEKKVPVKTGKAMTPIRRVPSTSVFATFDDLLANFRRDFRESFWAPWDWAIEPYRSYDVEFPVRAAFSDLIDAGNNFLIRAEVPGIPREKIDVNITKSGIEISAEASEETEEKDNNYILKERSYSSIYKNLEFPEEVIPEKAESTFKDGLLEVYVPKKTIAPTPKKHKVAVK